MRNHRAVCAALALLLLSGCAAPLGPGFRTEQESFDLRFVTTPPAELQVRARYLLKNIGNRPLPAIEVTLPAAKSFGRQNLRVVLDGREVLPRGPEDAEARSIQIPFDPPWPQKQMRELVIEYELKPATPGDALIAINENSVHLRDYGWFPELLAPEALFAKRGRAKKVRLTARVPEGFRVRSGGREKAVTHRGGEADYRFELRKHEGQPFLVAGRYSETRAETPNGAVVFWTFQPLRVADVERAAARIAASFKTYEESFGRLDGRSPALWIVESPARLAQHARSPGGGQSPAGCGFPAGALLNEPAFALGVSSDAFLSLVEHELAHAWFGQALAARPEAEALMTEGLAEYAALVAEEARGGVVARQRHAALLLRWYDESRRQAAEKPLVALSPNDPWEQRVFGYNKGALFFVALEDECGKDAVRHGLARMVRALHGHRAGLQELRSAMEDEAGLDLAGFFRAWLSHPGVPPDFRARYELKPRSTGFQPVF